MVGADPLTLAVRGYAAWSDVVCRLHRFSPEGDGRVWWSARRTPDLVPDAVTLAPDVSEFDVLRRINDSAGASVSDSFATLDLTDQGWSVSSDATWIVHPSMTGAHDADHSVASTFAVVREKFVFAAWCRAEGNAAGVLPAALRRAPGVTVLGREGDGGFTDGGLVHSTAIGGTAVVGLWNAFGALADVAAATAHRHPEAWIVGHERGAALDAALAAGFTAVGPLRVWTREPERP